MYLSQLPLCSSDQILICSQVNKGQSLLDTSESTTTIVLWSHLAKCNTFHAYLQSENIAATVTCKGGSCWRKKGIRLPKESHTKQCSQKTYFPAHMLHHLKPWILYNLWKWIITCPFLKCKLTSGPLRKLTFYSATCFFFSYPPEAYSFTSSIHLICWSSQVSLLSAGKTCSSLKLYCITVACKFLVHSLGIQSNKWMCV